MFQLCTVHRGGFRIINFTFPADAKKQTMYFSLALGSHNTHELVNTLPTAFISAALKTPNC